MRGGLSRLTDPILIKKPKVAAEDPIYVARVAIDPLGPGPALILSPSWWYLNYMSAQYR